MRLRYSLLLSCLLVCNIFSSRVLAARTGRFDTTVVFKGSRVLSCYVPTNYNGANKYRLMVCLHGLGDNSANYCNYITSGAGAAWSTRFPNTIFICPEASATTDDYYQYSGDEVIIQKCIDVAMTNYHIDSSDVILQGFSLGGRAALRYGLDNYTKFKGLLLNTPAIQGVKNALNVQASYPFQRSYFYTYANSSHIPIYITHGETDPLYEPPIDTALKQMVLNDGMVRYNDVPNMGHQIPSFNQMADVLQFLTTPARPGNDLEVFELDAPARTCSASVAPRALIRNAGSDTITSAIFAITLNGQAQPFVWNDSLLPFQHKIVTLPTLLLASGQNILEVRVDTIDGVLDTYTSNNDKIDTFEYVSRGTSLPISEGFEESTFSSEIFPPPGWLLQEAGDVWSPWFLDTVKKSGTFSAGAFNSPYIFDNVGRAEGLLSPVLDLTTIPNPQMSFDLTYNYDRLYSTTLADTLDILISTDGGVTYTSLFRKAGAALATFASPIINPQSINDQIIAPQDSNWRHYAIDLGPYASAPEAIVKFNYISGLGGTIYIDNVDFTGPLSSVPVSIPISYRMYPNPATDRITVAGDPSSQVKITVMDVAGRHVLSAEGMTDGSGEFLLDTHALIAGVYFVRTSIGHFARTEKLTIQR